VEVACAALKIGSIQAGFLLKNKTVDNELSGVVRIIPLRNRLCNL
jgi:hypothetical protein